LIGILLLGVLRIVSVSQEVEDTANLKGKGDRGEFKQVSSAFSKNILYRKST